MQYRNIVTNIKIWVFIYDSAPRYSVIPRRNEKQKLIVTVLN